MGQIANRNEIMTAEMHARGKQSGCYCHKHVYNKKNLLR